MSASRSSRTKGKLIAVDSFRASPELRPLQPLNDEPKSLDLKPRLGELRLIARHLRSQVTHQLVQRIDVRRQRREIDSHDTNLTSVRGIAQSLSSRESISRSVRRCIAQPATAGRHRRSGARQSTPSISIDNCAELSISVPPGSAFDGQRKTPCSSRLVKREANPIPEHDLDEVSLPAPAHEEVSRDGRKIDAVPLNQRRTDNEPKDRASMVAAARTRLSPML